MVFSHFVNFSWLAIFPYVSLFFLMISKSHAVTLALLLTLFFLQKENLDLVFEINTPANFNLNNLLF